MDWAHTQCQDWEGGEGERQVKNEAEACESFHSATQGLQLLNIQILTLFHLQLRVGFYHFIRKSPTVLTLKPLPTIIPPCFSQT